jgi:hypothetical protein
MVISLCMAGPTIFSPDTHVHRGDRFALVHLPHLSSISVVGVVRHYGGRSQLCVSTSLEDLPHTYSCTWCYYSKKKMETKSKALLAEELGSLYSNSNIFVFCFFRRTRCKNQHHLQTKIKFSMRETYSRILTYLPHTWSLHC